MVTKKVSNFEAMFDLSWLGFWSASGILFSIHFGMNFGMIFGMHFGMDFKTILAPFPGWVGGVAVGRKSLSWRI